MLFFFFFNDTATTEIYTLSLHDALPIWRVHAAVPPVRGAGEVLRLRLAAQRVRRARLRVRLLGRQPEGAGPLGGAVRRLHQRRADGDRRVHHLRRGQVGPAVGRGAPAAADRKSTRLNSSHANISYAVF